MGSTYEWYEADGKGIAQAFGAIGGGRWAFTNSIALADNDWQVGGLFWGRRWRASYWSDSRLAQYCPSSATSRIASDRLTFWSRYETASRERGGRDATGTALPQRCRPQPTRYAS
jgi:hypothetical protein